MPEAAVYEYGLVAALHDDIRLAGQLGVVKPVPNPHRMQQPTYAHLRRCILAANLGHEFGTLFGGEAICH